MKRIKFLHTILAAIFLQIVFSHLLYASQHQNFSPFENVCAGNARAISGVFGSLVSGYGFFKDVDSLSKGQVDRFFWERLDKRYVSMVERFKAGFARLQKLRKENSALAPDFKISSIQVDFFKWYEKAFAHAVKSEIPDNDAAIMYFVITFMQRSIPDYYSLIIGEASRKVSPNFWSVTEYEAVYNNLRAIRVEEIIYTVEKFRDEYSESQSTALVKERLFQWIESRILAGCPVLLGMSKEPVFRDKLLEGVLNFRPGWMLYRHDYSFIAETLAGSDPAGMLSMVLDNRNNKQLLHSEANLSSIYIMAKSMSGNARLLTEGKIEIFEQMVRQLYWYFPYIVAYTKLSNRKKSANSKVVTLSKFIDESLRNGFLIKSL